MHVTPAGDAYARADTGPDQSSERGFDVVAFSPYVARNRDGGAEIRNVVFLTVVVMCELCILNM
ncbi:hypothetical protein J5N97_013661 [Dioscorea zingiberensis]|uniref:Uncharacterized protein n=1 Tax=Dioscorea zingiberensis TaxID=325984 RepID=A0A9D5CSI1_9LILI|nr:hypothetical protein J5N97_013661 [Dioscorea zingiberensis]